MLGSWFGLAATILPAGALILRTALEDRELHRRLDGYADYAQRVRYRLIPRVWCEELFSLRSESTPPMRLLEKLSSGQARGGTNGRQLYRQPHPMRTSGASMKFHEVHAIPMDAIRAATVTASWERLPISGLPPRMRPCMAPATG